MADITGILAGWEPGQREIIRPPEDQLRQAMMDAGIEPPEYIDIDGRIHRFRSGTKGSGGHGDKTGWYVAFSDGVPAGRFGCWRSGIEITWRAEIGRDYTQAEQMAMAARMAEARALRDAERAKKQESAAHTVDLIWQQAICASSDHPYLARKMVQPHGLRVTGDGRLIAPLYAPDGGLASLQYIDADGGKLYHAGGQTGGCCWQIGEITNGIIYIAEGVATAATIHEATGRPCMVAYSASNLVPVTGLLRERFGACRDLVIVADNDASGTGQKYADQASAKHGARVVMVPVEGMDANDYAHAGHDIGQLLAPPVSSWLVQADEFASKPAPIKWIIKHWLPENALIMLHGKSGGGKTFVLLDMLLTAASSRDNADWMGNKVRPCNVLYLAGEGHHGLRGRIAGWKQAHGISKVRMWVSRDGCDLNTPAGLQKVRDSIRQLPAWQWPSIIAVDTLHRFLSGDENSAQDTKTMLDACAVIMQEFGCSVVLVHHTGVSDEAQHRARGSSAWRGALDIEISVVPGDNGQPIEIVQRKSKDAEIAEPLFARLESTPIDGWMDDDGEQVTTAILRRTVSEDGEERKHISAEQSRRITILRNAWDISGQETRDGQPYISRAALMRYLLDEGIVARDTAAEQWCKPAGERGGIKPLIDAKIIADVRVMRRVDGYIVTCQQTAAQFVLGAL